MSALLVLATGTAALVRSGLSPNAFAANPAPTAPLAFQKDVRPLLDASCAKCHNATKHKGDVDFSPFTDDKSAARGRKVWRKAIEQVEAGDMPPESEKPMAAGQKDQLLRWMRQAVTADLSDPSLRDPGPAVVRRLNRAEYENTIRDLVGIKFDAGAAVGMPDDTPVTGYSTLANALTLPPALMDQYFSAADAVLDQVFGYADGSKFQYRDGGAKKEAEKAKAALLAAKPEGGRTKRDAARKVIEPFAARAFRRPVEPAEVDRLVALFDLADHKGDSFEAGVRLMLKAVLVSPKFLLRVEQDRGPAGSDQPYRVGDYELAARLTYFLWSSLPDKELTDLAAAGKLSDPAVLEQQARRMLADPKAKALTDNFAAQWLQIGKVQVARPSTEFFPTFSGQVRQAMYDEATTFFDHLRTDDRPITDLLDADYTYANEDLAKHYGLEPVKGREMRKVALKPADHRGGLMGMGAFLAATSHVNRTSPTLRGKYVLEVIFGTPPPPPPANAGMFKDEKKGKEPKDFREKLAQHAADPTCAACHKRIDPLGFGLENFDAVGRWRADVGGKPVDNGGKLTTGETFAGADELKQIVLKRKGEFVRNVVEQVLKYGLGRDLDWYDEPTVDQTTAALEKDGYKFSTLMLGVVKSYPFQYRKNAAP